MISAGSSRIPPMLPAKHERTMRCRRPHRQDDGFQTDALRGGQEMADRKRPLSRLWRALGPGLTTGAADDDPSGIATYSQAGAQFGFALTWTLLLTLPFMAAVQIISAWIGWETQQGLAKNIALRLPGPVVMFLVAMLVIANTINIAADLAAMGEGLQLVVGGPALLYA